MTEVVGVPEEKKNQKKSEGASENVSAEIAETLSEGEKKAKDSSTEKKDSPKRGEKPTVKADALPVKKEKTITAGKQEVPKNTPGEIKVGTTNTLERKNSTPVVAPVVITSSEKKEAPNSTEKKKPWYKKIFSKKSKNSSEKSSKKPGKIKTAFKNFSTKWNKEREGPFATVGKVPGWVANWTKGWNKDKNLLKNFARGAFFPIRATARAAEFGLNAVGDTVRGVLTPKSWKRPWKVNWKEKYKKSADVWDTFWGKSSTKTK